MTAYAVTIYTQTVHFMVVFTRTLYGGCYSSFWLIITKITFLQKITRLFCLLKRQFNKQTLVFKYEIGIWLIIGHQPHLCTVCRCSWRLQWCFRYHCDFEMMLSPHLRSPSIWSLISLLLFLCRPASVPGSRRHSVCASAPSLFSEPLLLNQWIASESYLASVSQTCPWLWHHRHQHGSQGGSELTEWGV